MSSRTFGRETKFQKVRTELEALANRLGPEQKLPSIRELAVTMNASVSTLTGALDDLESQNLVYRKHGVGIFVSPSRVKSIWLICDSQFFSHGHSPFWDVLMDEARERAAQHNEHLSLHFTLPQGRPDATLHHALVEEIQAGRVHGIIGVGLSRGAAQWILDQGVPFTAFAGWAPFIVALHHTEVVRQGVEALISKGCKNISFWKPAELANPERDNEQNVDRSEVIFRETLRCHGLQADPALFRFDRNGETPAAVESFQQQGYQVVKDVFERDGLRPDGVIITDDTMTRGALLAMARLGIHPGRDVQLVSHSNRGTAVLLEDEQIIRLEFDPAEVVRRLFSLLETLMSGAEPKDLTRYYVDSQALMIEPKLIFPSNNSFT